MISSSCHLNNADHKDFGDLLRHWRTVRGVSQLHLALDEDVSTRHGNAA